MTTYAQFLGFLHLILQVVEGDATFSDELLYSATLGAIDAILPWCRKTAVAEYSADGVKNQFDLPADVYQVDGVELYKEDVQRVFLDKALISPGRSRVSKNTTYEGDCDWLLYPAGKLYLSKVLESGWLVRLFYQAYFPKPSSATDNTFTFATPSSALHGMLYWAAAECLASQSSASANIRQFNRRVDSGTPVDNVLEQSAKFYRAMFIDEMSRQPK